ncbi:Uma2 family endonuclease [Alkalinema sp. FACHB-956]|uniref:Uma2 family endonuclease n=1 Tax=Alkalinema sp. FACHB-956 TaxID=2692768 RepID=UPI001686E786|nr:Uma2 family endonuclease [Alkalinema sp. FACHB-956]MBD2330014.1 Uma2 family endonuclease [Alkalinema sp. FACHB-956]
MVAVVPQPISPSPVASSVVLSGISWETYQALVRELESQPSKRLTYDNGTLEIFMPLPPHESYSAWSNRFIQIVTEELEVEIRSLGSSTWTRQDLAKGIEADECYYLQNEQLIRGKLSIDLATDPPPDLAIEIDITSLSIPRLPIYQALAVPEIWRFDGEKVMFLALNEGEYQEIDRSIALPIVTPSVLQNWLMQATTMGETSWAKAIRRWVQDTVQMDNFQGL